MIKIDRGKDVKPNNSVLLADYGHSGQSQRRQANYGVDSIVHKCVRKHTLCSLSLS